jgi:aminopeptidase
MDPRFEKLADGLVNFSMDVQPDERVLIDAGAVPEEMVVALIRAVRRRNGRPFIQWQHARSEREWLLHGTAEDFEIRAALDLDRMEKMQCYVALRGSDNSFEMGDVAGDRQKTYYQRMQPVSDRRINHTRWVVLRWPNPAMAQSARMSTEGFENFFFQVCTLDYASLIPGMAAMKERMERTDRVRIVSPGTDLQFSIKGMGAIPCGGKHNIPDGEVFTAPIRDSVEGTIAYNTPSIYQGKCFENVKFRFHKGCIVEASANHCADLHSILNSDPGARYIGEFSLGFNPHILQPIGDTLFDEKIAGSLHFTPGRAYENEADNGNRSQIHWDLVLIQRPEWGGGEIYFDGEPVRRDGIFVVPELDRLNPQNLLPR